MIRLSSAICLGIFCLSISSQAQKIKNKDVKKALEENKVKEISIVSSDQFIPHQKQEMDLQVTLLDGTTVLASDYPVIWDKTECNVINAGWKIRDELLTNGKGVILPYILPLYYAKSDVSINMTLLGKTVSKKLTASFCMENYRLVQKGDNGQDGDRGYDGTGTRSGSSGGDGSKGEQGPSFEVRVEEEVIDSKEYLVLSIGDQKYKFDPSCSSVTVVSLGGKGGKGGIGGDGGDSDKDNKNEYKSNGGRGGYGGSGGRGGMGGTITVTGNAVEKYKSKLTFVSEGGEGGNGGRGGDGGKGKSNGIDGMDGSDGYKGAGGQVVFQ